MNIAEHLVSPSYHRQPDFKSAELITDYEWKCTICSSPIRLTFEDASNLYWHDSLSLGAKEHETVKKIYGIGSVGKSHDGGWPYFVEMQCAECKERYMIYVGIKEPTNSCLHITVQAISRWS